MKTLLRRFDNELTTILIGLLLLALWVAVVILFFASVFKNGQMFGLHGDYLAGAMLGFWFHAGFGVNETMHAALTKRADRQRSEQTPTIVVNGRPHTMHISRGEWVSYYTILDVSGDTDDRATIYYRHGHGPWAKLRYGDLVPLIDGMQFHVFSKT